MKRSEKCNMVRHETTRNVSFPSSSPGVHSQDHTDSTLTAPMTFLKYSTVTKDSALKEDRNQDITTVKSEKKEL